ncbi:S8 family serine peptidase [Rugamonas sp.]|uniref:S8 family peptidase n=1 Tax=Rugamonas sp. TaxID=1926287 RepID=UPI0025EFFB93|nr:S8 family serine peptidase [Rugamonas sp.]
MMPLARAVIRALPPALLMVMMLVTLLMLAVPHAIGATNDANPASTAPAAQNAPPAPYVTDDAAHAVGAAEAPAATAHTAPERKVLVMLRLPAPHFRPDASYGGRYIDDGGRNARHRIAADLAQRHGLKLLSDWPMPTLGVDCYVMEYADGDSADAIAATLSRDPRVEWAQPVALFLGMGAAGGDPLYPVQPSAKYWHIAELHRTTTGRDVSVAVIDSGIDGQHPDLLGQVALAENFVDDGAAPAEAHGTAVAGIIAARSGNGGIVGVAPGARLLALRACWQQPDLGTRCNSFTLAKALNFAILNHARIINLSLSGPPDRLLDRLLDVALERGIAVVGAVDPQGGAAAFPASHPGVIAVAQQGAGDARAASPASWAPSPPSSASPARSGTVYAPGRDIPTTAPGARWSFVSGSSYAAAHVSGMIALLSQLRPASTPEQLRRQLQPIDGLNAGNIDACATITRVTGACSCSCATAVQLKVDTRP